MKDYIISDILVKELSGEQLSPEEEVLLNNWLGADEKHRSLFLTLKDDSYFQKKLIEMHQIDMDGAKRKIDERIEAGGKLTFLGWRWVQYAAAVVLVISVATWFWISRTSQAGKQQANNKNSVAVKSTDVAPGQSKATLTLSDGRKIILDSGTVSNLDERGQIVIKNSDGKLVYQQGQSPSGEILYNTLTTSKGETYSIVLSDGTTVTLNSASSIRYPIVFPGGERKTEITGEAFFDVTHNVDQPFVVSIPGKDIDVKVLGTQFNISDYEDDRPRVTLVKGSVMVNLNRVGKAGNIQKSVFIKPGQQAFVADNKLAVTDHINMDEVLAWKNGLFYFDNASITTVMHQLERWYNIEVVYQGAKPTQAFGGELQRDLKLSQVIRALEHTGMRFKIEGRKLIVMQ